jgi:hypothetical protein
MGTRHILPLLTAIVAGIASPVLAEPTLKKEIDVSFAPLEVVKPVLDPVLSPLGKFLMLANKGAVLVIDTPGGILATEQAIAAAQFPPADVALEFQFVTGLPARKTSIMVGQEVPFPTARPNRSPSSAAGSATAAPSPASRRPAWSCAGRTPTACRRTCWRRPPRI